MMLSNKIIKNRSRSAILTLCYSLLLISFISVSTSRAEINDKVRATAELYLKGAAEELAGIRSGICDISIKCEGTTDGGLLGNLVHVKVAFDKLENCLRVEKKYQYRPKSVYIENSLESLLFQEGERKVRRLPLKSEIKNQEISPVDFRVCVFGDWSIFEQGGSISDVMKTITPEFVSKFESQENDGVFIQLKNRINSGGDLFREFWIEKKDGFRLRKATQYAIVPWPGQAENSKTIRHEFYTASTVWTKISGVFAPTQIKITSPYYKRSWTEELNWQQLGEKIPGELFTVDGINAPPGTLIINQMLPGKGVVEQITGTFSNPRKGQNSVKTTPQSRWPSIPILIGFNVAAICVCVAVVFRKKIALKSRHAIASSESSKDPPAL